MIRKTIKGGNFKPQMVGELVFDQTPKEGSFNPVTSDAVAKIASSVADINAIVPDDASEENKLATAADVAGVQEDVDTIDGKIPSDTSTTNKLVNESGLQDAIDNASESWSTGFTPKGESSVSDLNDLTTQSNGDSYIVTDSGTLTDGSLAVVAGDQVAWDATNSVWYKLPQYALKQFGTNEIDNLSTTITSFRSGDVIVVGGPSGAAKMSKDTLLTLTAQNALAGNVAEEFVENVTNAVAGFPYIWNGEVYLAKEDYTGSWNAEKFKKTNVSIELYKKLSQISLVSILGDDTDEIKILTDNNEIVLSIKDGVVEVSSLKLFNGSVFEQVFTGGVQGKRTIDADSIVITDSNYNFVCLIDDNGIHAKAYYIRNTLNGNDEPLSVDESVEVVLPSKFTAVVDDNLQLFFRGMIKHPNPYVWANNVNCSVGKNTPRFYEVTPTVADVGEKPLTLNVKTKDGKVVGTASTTLKIVNKPSSPISAKKILCFGDSLTSGGVWCAEAYRRLTGSGGTPEGLGLTNIDFCGRQTNNGAGYFGIGGWSWSDYTTAGRRAIRFQVTGVDTLSYGAVYTNNGHNYTIIENNTTEGTGNILCSVDYNSSYVPDSTMTLTKSSGSGDATITYTSYSEDSQNPLWDYSENKMTFVPYANEVSNGQIDVVYTLLTWNGLTGYKTDFTDIMAKVKTFADTLHAEFPNAKFKLMGLQMPSVNGGIGANYGANGNYYDWYGLQVTAMNMSKAYKAFAESDGYSSFVEFVNVSAEFDSEWNMPHTNSAVNSRNSTTEIRGTNGVHPATEGYMQIGDVVYRNLCEYINSL